LQLSTVFLKHVTDNFLAMFGVERRYNCIP
jgi:hypothetical protein